MTKEDLIQSIVEKTGFTHKETFRTVEQIFEIMKTTLESGEQVKISGFGTFNVKSKKPRKGRNPQTGEPMEISARNVLKFTASPVLNKKVNANKR
jgi:integration host factor subunit alpha